MGGGLAAWRSGYVILVHDALTAPSADDVTISSGVFARTLSLEIDRRFTEYPCEVRRGPRYPETAYRARLLVENAATTGERAAMSAVADKPASSTTRGFSAERVEDDEEGGPVEAKVRGRCTPSP